jgi:transcriptional antiterminator NusG
MAEEKTKEEKQTKESKTTIFGLRTTANREDQVMDFVISNAQKKKLEVYGIVRAHGMRGYIFMEAGNRQDAEQAAFNIPYARGILPKEIDYSEIEHMLEIVKVEMNIKKNDIVEIISGPFRRENAKVTRIDKAKEEVVVELLEAAVPIPITVKMDAVKVIRREKEEGEEEEKIEEKLPLTGMEKPKEEATEFVMPEVSKKTDKAVEMPKEVEEEEEPKEEKKEEKPKEEAKPKKIKLGVSEEKKKEEPEDEVAKALKEAEVIEEKVDLDLGKEEKKKEKKKEKSS